MQRPRGLVPVESCGAIRGGLLTPKYPCREDAVKQRLHQGGAEEEFTFLSLELDAKGCSKAFRTFARAGSSPPTGLGLDAGLGIAGIGREKPCHVFRGVSGGRGT